VEHPLFGLDELTDRVHDLPDRHTELVGGLTVIIEAALLDVGFAKVRDDLFLRVDGLTCCVTRDRP